MSRWGTLVPSPLMGRVREGWPTFRLWFFVRGSWFPVAEFAKIRDASLRRCNSGITSDRGNKNGGD